MTLRHVRGRQMARRVAPARRAPRTGLLLGGATLLILVALVGALAVLGQPPDGSRSAAASAATPQATTRAVAYVTPRPALTTPLPRPAGTTAPSASPRPSATARPPASASARPSPAQTAAVRGPRAPRGPAGFDLTGQTIDIGFPLRPDVKYHYRDNWLDRRDGEADPYNHARRTDDGRLLRLHDGIDIYGPRGTPVIAPFDGRVIDPARRWQPWEVDRYGLTVVIQSTEPGTAGYTAVMVHLEHIWVDHGQRVSRGQVIGVLGRTGNAAQTRAHLHFELRAPFLIDWSAIGHRRRVDAFNPFPSLVEADPHR